MQCSRDGRQHRFRYGFSLVPGYDRPNRHVQGVSGFPGRERRRPVRFDVLLGSGGVPVAQPSYVLPEFLVTVSVRGPPDRKRPGRPGDRSSRPAPALDVASALAGLECSLLAQAAAARVSYAGSEGCGPRHDANNRSLSAGWERTPAHSPGRSSERRASGAEGTAPAPGPTPGWGHRPAQRPAAEAVVSAIEQSFSGFWRGCRPSRTTSSAPQDPGPRGLGVVCRPRPREASRPAA